MTELVISRRSVLAGGTGLIIATWIAGGPKAAPVVAPRAAFVPNAYVRIAPDDTVTVIVKHTEMGQGPLTGLATLVAEELDADWSQMRAETAPANAALYANFTMGPAQGTAGSTAILSSWALMRKAGATARAMLVEAAARQWNVPVAAISVRNGVLSHAATGRSSRFGALVQAAAALSPPEQVSLKDPSAFRLIGREGAVTRIDVPAKTDGSAEFTMDIHEPGMLTVVVAHPPRFGGKVASFDATETMKVKGVVAVKQIPSGVAIYATGTWPALKGRDRLQITWDDSAAEKRGSKEIAATFKAMAQSPGSLVRATGDVDAVLRSGTSIEVEYLFPYLAHAPMEPLDGFMIWDGEHVKSRHGSQLQTADQMQIAGLLGVKPQDVEIETMLAGGGFGRRIDQGNDMLADLAGAAKAIGPNRPVKLVWSREDDLTGGFYRSMFVHKFRGAVRDGKIAAWHHTIVGQSFMIGTPFEALMIKNGVDMTMVTGAATIPYAIPNFRCDVHIARTGVTTGSWRSVTGTHVAYAVECFIDQLLDMADQDPVAGRLAMMDASPRCAGVLREVAKLAGWAGPRTKDGRARGVAVVEQSSSYVAQIAEVSLDQNGQPKVHKIWCAVDCGVAVNPDNIRAQIEGGIAFGLGHALYAEIELVDGIVKQRNFDSYRSLRIDEMPEIEIMILKSDQEPTGIGEVGVPPAGPAVANAIARLGRERPSQLPMIKKA